VVSATVERMRSEEFIRFSSGEASAIASDG
jgi:hypothetical protein